MWHVKTGGPSWQGNLKTGFSVPAQMFYDHKSCLFMLMGAWMVDEGAIDHTIKLADMLTCFEDRI